MFKKIEQGKVLVISGVEEARVSFESTSIDPELENAEIIDLSVKRVELIQLGKEGLHCQDNIRVDLKIKFFIRVNRREEDILAVAQMVGCEKATDQDTLDDLFKFKFLGAVKIMLKRFNFTSLVDQLEEFKHMLIESIQADLNGYTLDDLSIGYLEQTPINFLDPNNIFDAEGLQKITAIRMYHKERTDSIYQEAFKVTENNVATKILELTGQLDAMIDFASINDLNQLEILKDGKKINLQSKAKENVTEITHAKLVYAQSSECDKNLYIIKPI